MILRYYVTPLLHQALAHFELPGPTVADKDIYAHCLRFMAETYKRMPELLDLPDYIPQPFPNIQLRDAAIAAGKLAPDELAAQSPLTRLMTHLVYGLHHLYGHGEKLPTRAGERNDDSIPGAPGLT
ncbi:MAG: hypothetical protein HY053_06445 [Proteobacteria bacterium]|nr:hypothetical protein [Pseudomonadota bacterium]